MFMHWAPISFDDDWVVVTIIDILVVVRIFQAHVLFLKTGWTAGNAALIPCVERQTEHVLLIDEENYHHPSFGIDRTLHGRAPAIVRIWIDMRVGVRAMERQ